MGMSVASLFGYRAGSFKISPKAWGKLEKAEREAGIQPALKARFLAEPDWMKRAEMVQQAEGMETFMLLCSSESDIWLDCPPDMRDEMLSRYSVAVEGLLWTLDAEEMGGLDEKTKLQRAHFYAEVGKLKPLFDSWRSSLRKQAEAAATEALVKRRDALAQSIEEAGKELVDIAERLSSPKAQDTVMGVASKEERFRLLAGIEDAKTAAATVKSGRPEKSTKAADLPLPPPLQMAETHTGE